MAGLVLLLVGSPLAARQPATSATADSQDSQGNVVTQHELRLPDRTLRYTATAGYIRLKDPEDKPRAKVFFMAYELTPQEPVEQPTTRPATESSTRPASRIDRPITFVFNGGPGAASVWLHLGTAGPKRVVMPDDGSLPAPPYQLQDNPCTWLDFTDLVFIDPVGTGFSRAENPDRAKEFYSVQGDIASVADVIRLYLNQSGRWLSPKFIAGESYGTTRAAGLSEHLNDRFGIAVNGIVLISTVLNFQTLQFRPGNDTPYPLWLPSYTAVAHYHKRLPPELQQMRLAELLEQVERWAFEHYLPALMKGTDLDEQARRGIARQLSRYTGLPMEYLDRANLKVPPGRFQKALLREQGKIVGRMDGRITAPDADPLSDRPDFDPSMHGYFGVFSTTFNDYVRRELNFQTDLTYEFLTHTFDPGRDDREGYLDVSPALRSAMAKVPAMRVAVCSGWHDLATPFAAADYTINQLPLSRQQRQNIAHFYYDGGHMMYLTRASLAKLHEDLAGFYRIAVPPL
ncbi:S10 family peptidase [Fontivita pretiosa]|uniref:S10 family peptidase n=1 Tax=Fontivita pretiosa TaxID=2989684 RepID=UPI003D16AFE5